METKNQQVKWVSPNARRKRVFINHLIKNGLDKMEAERQWSMLGLTARHNPIRSAKQYLMENTHGD